MKTLRDVIKIAEQKAVAVGHFNISNIEGLWAVFNSARKLNVPVIIGLSEGERNFFGLRQAVVLVKSLREEFDFPIYINADHSYSFETAKEAVLAGCDSVIFDGTKLSIEENIKITKEVVDFVKEYNKENTPLKKDGPKTESTQEEELDESPKKHFIKEEDRKEE
jgi:fructose-bisphosphate aldolase class II